MSNFKKFFVIFYSFLLFFFINTSNTKSSMNYEEIEQNVLTSIRKTFGEHSSVEDTILDMIDSFRTSKNDQHQKKNFFMGIALLPFVLEGDNKNQITRNFIGMYSLYSFSRLQSMNSLFEQEEEYQHQNPFIYFLGFQYKEDTKKIYHLNALKYDVIDYVFSEFIKKISTEDETYSFDEETCKDLSYFPLLRDFLFSGKKYNFDENFLESLSCTDISFLRLIDSEKEPLWAQFTKQFDDKEIHSIIKNIKINKLSDRPLNFYEAVRYYSNYAKQVENLKKLIKQIREIPETKKINFNIWENRRNDQRINFKNGINDFSFHKKLLEEILFHNYTISEGDIKKSYEIIKNVINTPSKSQIKKINKTLLPKLREIVKGDNRSISSSSDLLKRLEEDFPDEQKDDESENKFIETIPGFIKNNHSHEEKKEIHDDLQTKNMNETMDETTLHSYEYDYEIHNEFQKKNKNIHFEKEKNEETKEERKKRIQSAFFYEKSKMKELESLSPFMQEMHIDMLAAFLHAQSAAFDHGRNITSPETGTMYYAKKYKSGNNKHFKNVFSIAYNVTHGEIGFGQRTYVKVMPKKFFNDTGKKYAIISTHGHLW